MSSTPVPRFLAAIESGITTGLHIGAQAHVIQHDKVIADFAAGESRPGVAMTTDTLMLWLSATKPVTAVAIAQLWERGQITPDDSVSRHVPEFAVNGKKTVTIRHLLTHTAGIRGAANNFTRDSWETTLARICNSSLEPGWVPGRKAGYHLASSWFLLGEIIRRVDGRRFERYVRDEIFLPLGMLDSWVGLPPDRYAEYGDRIGIMQNTDPAMKLPHAWDTPEMAALCKPGGNGRGPVRELAQFYQMLLNGGSLNGARVLSLRPSKPSPHAIASACSTTRSSTSWTGAWVSSSTTTNTAQTPSATATAPTPPGEPAVTADTNRPSPSPTRNTDWRRQWCSNGTPGEIAHDQRVRAVLTALYEDIGINSNDEIRMTNQ